MLSFQTNNKYYNLKLHIACESFILAHMHLTIMIIKHMIWYYVNMKSWHIICVISILLFEKIGELGVKGVIGIIGVIGATGDNGSEGEIGTTGEKGNKGLKGNIGQYPHLISSFYW